MPAADPPGLHPRRSAPCAGGQSLVPVTGKTALDPADRNPETNRIQNILQRQQRRCIAQSKRLGKAGAREQGARKHPSQAGPHLPVHQQYHRTVAGPQSRSDTRKFGNGQSRPGAHGIGRGPGRSGQADRRRIGHLGQRPAARNLDSRRRNILVPRAGR